MKRNSYGIGEVKIDVVKKNVVVEKEVLVSEGDEIITTLEYSKENNEFIVTKDNTRDEFATEKDRKVETKKYSNDTYDLEKRIKNNNIHLVLVNDETEINICVYDKELEANKDANSSTRSFFAKIVESNAKNIIVEPVEDSLERKTSDKFLIKLGDTNDEIYPIGTNVKITYNGDFAETYPVTINPIKIEIKSTDNFELIFHGRKDLWIKTIVANEETDKYSYNIFSKGGDFEIKIDGAIYDLRDALLNDKITMEEIIQKANKDIPNAVSYDSWGRRTMWTRYRNVL